jgi:hypothetical protein
MRWGDQDGSLLFAYFLFLRPDPDGYQSARLEASEWAPRMLVITALGCFGLDWSISTSAYVCCVGAAGDELWSAVRGFVPTTQYVHRCRSIYQRCVERDRSDLLEHCAKANCTWLKGRRGSDEHATSRKQASHFATEAA